MRVRRLITTHAFVVSISATTVVSGCSFGFGSPSTTTSPAAPTSPDILVLTASNTLERLSPVFGLSPWKVSLGGSTQLSFTAHLIAILRGASQAAVLIRGATSEVVIVDLRNGKVIHRRQLPGGLDYRGLDVGPITGRVYVYANREVGQDRGPTKGPPSDAVALVLTPDLGNVVLSQTVRPAAGFDWYVYRGGLDSAEKHLLLSYHGPDTTGVELIDVAGDTLHNNCTQPGYGCVQSHGGFVFVNGYIWFTTGSSVVLELDQSGHAIKRVDTGIQNEHVMELAVDSSAQHIFIAGSCLYSRGLFELNLATLRTVPIDKQGSNVCGERVLPLTAYRVAVLDPDVLVIDVGSGRVDRRIDLSSDAAIDGITIPA